ncbi:MAG: FkbM family methyltransferase [Williamsia sp.]|nr:FkbM family methyltransferase [Williamsia sp.]
MLIKLFQSLPQFKGKNRIARWLLKSTIKEKKDIILAGHHQLQYKIPNFVEPVGFDILIDGIHEEQTSAFIRKHVPPNGTFIDIGANIGSITMPVCRQRPDIKAISIEASPRVFKYLEHNIALNNITNCTIVNKAVDHADGKIVDFYSQPELFGTGSMSAVFTSESEQVETITIDTLREKYRIPAISFIKIDIEGFEYFAFEGGQNTLKRDDAPDILFEFVDWAEKQARNLKPGNAQELLMSYGFDIYEFKNGKPAGARLHKPVVREGWVMLYATKRRKQ